MSITVTLKVTDPRLIAGVEYARNLKNETLGEDETPLTNAEYITFVFDSSIESYAQQAERAATLAAAGL